MSGQPQQKGGQNPYGQQGYGMSPADSFSGSGGYYSMGNSRRSFFGAPGFTPGQNPFASNPASAPLAPNPFAAGPNPFGSSGFNPQSASPQSPFASTGNNPFANSIQTLQSGQATPNSSGAFPTNPGNVDPNSPEYAAYYNSLPPSTRLYLAPPGSAQANFKYNDYNASMANPNQAHF